MEWTEVDPEDYPTEPGAYVICSNELEDEDGQVYTIFVYEPDQNFSKACMDTAGFIATHFIYLEPVPRYNWENFDEPI